MEKKNAKIMPHSVEAEQAILGCILIDENVPVEVMSKLGGEDFYIDAHSTIFEAMNKIYNSNAPVDFVTLSDELDKAGQLEQVGGIEYLTTLTNVVPSAVNFSHYMNIVKRDSVLRKLISSGQKIIENSYESDDKTEALSYAEKLILKLPRMRTQQVLNILAMPLKVL